MKHDRQQQRSSTRKGKGGTIRSSVAKQGRAAMGSCRRQSPWRRHPALVPRYYSWWLVLVTLFASSFLPIIRSEQAYPLGCSTKPPEYYDFESASFPPPNDGTIPIQSTENFLLVRRLGAGKFSDVFEAVDVELELQRQPDDIRYYEGKKDDCIELRTNIDPDTLVVLKCLKPVSERKIKRELLVLRHASSLPNLARLRAIVVPAEYVSSSKSSSSTSPPPTKKFKLQPMPSLVLEHAGVDSQWLCHTRDSYLTEEEMQYYLYHLLVALDALHSSGIMHRDVKPRNVLINRIPLKPQTTQTTSISAAQNGDSPSNIQSQMRRRNTPQPLMLIDLGLADFFFPDTKYNVRVASRHYKAPELLLGYEHYDYAIDVWGVGCILAGLLLRREPFFRGKDNMDQLGTIVAVLGTSDLHAYISKAKIEKTPEIRKVIAKYTLRGRGPKQDWETLARQQILDQHRRASSKSSSPPSTSTTTNEEGMESSFPMPSPEGIDLLSKLLVYDHSQRLTAKQAMQHTFFDKVRDRVEAEVREYHTSYYGSLSSSSSSSFAGEGKKSSTS